MPQDNPKAIFSILRDVGFAVRLKNAIDVETDLHFTLTADGLVVDLVDGDGEVVSSRCWTAQEFFDDVF